MRFDFISIFPQYFEPLKLSLIGKALDKSLIQIGVHDLRENATNVHRQVDDTPYGGGAGMVMKAEPLFASVEAAQPPRPLYLLGPGGRRFDQRMAEELAAQPGFSLMCGRYEGIDQRVADAPRQVDARRADHRGIAIVLHVHDPLQRVLRALARLGVARQRQDLVADERVVEQQRSALQRLQALDRQQFGVAGAGAAASHSAATSAATRST